MNLRACCARPADAVYGLVLELLQNRMLGTESVIAAVTVVFIEVSSGGSERGGGGDGDDGSGIRRCCWSGCNGSECSESYSILQQLRRSGQPRLASPRPASPAAPRLAALRSLWLSGSGGQF